METGVHTHVPSTHSCNRRVRVDKSAYNFMLSTHLEEVKAIGCLEMLQVIGDHDDLYVSGEDSPETQLVWTQFLALYNSVEANVTRTTLQLPREVTCGDLPNKLQDSFTCICLRSESPGFDLVCWKDDFKQIMSYVDDIIDHLDVCTYDVLADHMSGVHMGNGGISKSMVLGSTTPPLCPNHSRQTGRLPTGYDVGGRYHVILHVVDITKLHVDAITNAANKHLRHAGGVAFAIARAAGRGLLDECSEHIRSQKSVPISQVVRTTAGELGCGMVLHAVGPRWPYLVHTAARDRECLSQLKDTFYNVLDVAEQEGAKSLALPPISSGLFRVPLDHVAHALVEALLDKARQASASQLQHVHVVDLSDTFLNKLSLRLGSLCQDGTDREFVSVVRLQQEVAQAAVDQSLGMNITT